MTNLDIKKALAGLAIDVNAISDARIAATQKTLLNLVEVLVDQNNSLREDNQRLKDEINRLKGEQGKPNIRKQKKDGDTDHSSEGDRNKRKTKSSRKPKKKKKKHIKINRRETCDVDKAKLPDDAVFKGYETVVIQDIIIGTDNVEFSRASYYSPSLKKTFLGRLPEGYYGEFGPGVRSLVITLYRDSGMTEPAIKRFFDTFGIDISKSTISRMITERHENFHQEKEDIILAGLNSTRHQHIDDTGSRVNGKNHYTHILCNPYYTAFFTMPKKDRLTVLSILCCGELKFTFNEAAYELMLELGLSGKQAAALKSMNLVGDMPRKEIDNILQQLFPNPKKQKTNRRIILEACAIVYYKSLDYAIEHLVCDDAPQFNKIARYKTLCWIHEGRHYKKLNPFVEQHGKILGAFIDRFWDFYAELLAYKKRPSSEHSQELSVMFDNLFSIKTGYDALDERIAMTQAKKESLLFVLEFPFLPLHNNAAELGARVQARIRDINLQTITENGTKAKDTFATIVQTARKLGVNIYDYIYDRISKKYEMSSLAYLISEKTGLAPNTG